MPSRTSDEFSHPRGLRITVSVSGPTTRRDAIHRRDLGVRNDVARLWIPRMADGSCTMERAGPVRCEFEMARRVPQARVSIGRAGIYVMLELSELALSSAVADERSTAGPILVERRGMAPGLGRRKPPEKDRRAEMSVRKNGDCPSSRIRTMS